MPNTLAHLGIQALAVRAVQPHVDLKWVFVGCVIPDAPWILSRAVGQIWPNIDAFALRYYAIAQSTLLVSLVLCAGLAAFSSAPRRIFAVLAASSVLHLLLDASQTKWGNGVLMTAPFSWEQWNLGWFWPESGITLALTLGGLVAVALALLRPTLRPVALRLVADRRALAGAVLLAVYAAVPFALVSGPKAADCHSLRTLAEHELRPGRPLALDRHLFVPDAEPGVGGTIALSTGGTLRTEGLRPTQGPAAVSASIRGRFRTADVLVIEDYHVHSGWRDLASYLGLALVALTWAVSLRREARVP